MADWVVTIQGTEELMDSLSRISSNVSQAVGMALDESADRIKGEMISNAPQGATGGLRSSVEVSANGNSRTIGPGGDPGSRSHPLPKKYAFYVEGGYSPRWPAMPNRSDIAMRMGVDDKAAFLIARAIAKNAAMGGRTPSRFVENTYIYAQDVFNKVVEELISQAVS